MKNKWNEMTTAQKVLTVAFCIYVVAAIVFAVLDLNGTWKNEICTYMISAYCVVEGIMTWKKNRKMAILSFVLAIVLMVGTFSF